MSKNKIWVYGDSFTEGIGTLGLPGPGKDVKYAAKYGRYFWGNYYNSFYDNCFLLINKGKAGSSTQVILYSVLEDIELWEEGDKVIIGMSEPLRISFPCNDDRLAGGYAHVSYPHFSSAQWNMLTDDHQVNLMSAVYGGLEDEDYEDKDYIDPLHKEFFDKVVISNSSAYLRQSLYFKRLINNILRLGRGRGVEGLVWDQSLWPYFETLREWSYRGIDDLHWSPNGNIQFAHLLKDCMERGIYDLSQDILDYDGEYQLSMEESHWRKIGIVDYMWGDGVRFGKRRMINTSYATCLRKGDGYELDDNYRIKY